MKTLEADVLVPVSCELGEGPQWDGRNDRLLWLDIPAHVMHAREASSGAHTALPLERRVSCVVLHTDGGLVGAATDEVVRLDDDGTIVGTICPIPAAGFGGANDGAVDPWGRFWIGTSDRQGGEQGALSVVDPEGTAQVVKSGVKLSNGVDWSPDGRTAYHVDTMTHRIDAHSLDETGAITGTGILTEIDGMPDGLTVDEEGGVWVALWDRAAVHRYTPVGDLDTVVEVAGGHITSCAFGADGDTSLYITSAWSGMPDDLRSALPAAGALFVVDVGVGGRGVHRFGQVS